MSRDGMPAAELPRRDLGRLALGLRVAVSVGLLAGLAAWLDAGAVVSRLASMRPSWVLAALAVSGVQVAVLAWRWSFTARRLGVDLPWPVAWREYYLSIFLNQVLPGGVLGDVARAWRQVRSQIRVQAPRGPAVRAVVFERLSAQVVMTTAAGVSLLFLPVTVRMVAVRAGSGGGRRRPPVAGRVRGAARQRPRGRGDVSGDVPPGGESGGSRDAVAGPAPPGRPRPHVDADPGHGGRLGVARRGRRRPLGRGGVDRGRRRRGVGRLRAPGAGGKRARRPLPGPRPQARTLPRPAARRVSADPGRTARRPRAGTAGTAGGGRGRGTGPAAG